MNLGRIYYSLSPKLFLDNSCMMKVTSWVGNDKFAIPCTGDETVAWLTEETIRRALKIHPEYPDSQLGLKQLKKTRGGAILDSEDTIKSLLADEEHVFVDVHESSSKNSDNICFREADYCFPSEKHSRSSTEFLVLHGNSLSCADLCDLGQRKYNIKISHNAEKQVIASRNLFEDLVRQDKDVYGLTTGFGKFSQTAISKQGLGELQLNLIRSHAAGVGNCLPIHRIRTMFALRINVLAKGYSGISLKNMRKMVDIFNASCLPFVPEQGTVGASGDLAPLSHLALGLIGEGKMWSPETGWADAHHILEAHGLQPITLGPKEGLAMINGTQFIAALGVEAIERAQRAALQADVIAALSLEVLKGTTRAFDAGIHSARPHKGQIAVAERFRALLDSNIHPSEIAESHRFSGRLQDAYTLRCCPQVHGVVHDTIDFVRGVMTTELNSATDNPMVFPDRQDIISGGNFHGEYPAKMCDYLAIGIHELANMSERRIERLCNPSLSELPAFLTPNGGLNNGFMIAHCTAASLVSENKVLCHPASADTLSTSAAQEDHVSMGGFAARKALQVVENVERVLAIELLAACQALEFFRPLHTTRPLEEVHHLVRSVVGPWNKDRFMAPDIKAATDLIVGNKVWDVVKPHVDLYLNQEKPTATHKLVSDSTAEELAAIPA